MWISEYEHDARLVRPHRRLGPFVAHIASDGNNGLNERYTNKRLVRLRPSQTDYPTATTKTKVDAQ